jgi:hypothetical protein
VHAAEVLTSRDDVGTDENSEERPTAAELIEILSGDRFEKWYRERQYNENIKNGTPYFNGSGFTPEPHRHSPSKLLQCHRKIVYQQNNAPEQQSDQAGIFWIGKQFEADIAFPFLEDVPLRSVSTSGILSGSILRLKRKRVSLESKGRQTLSS